MSVSASCIRNNVCLGFKYFSEIQNLLKKVYKCMWETDYAYLCTKQKPLTNQTASMKAQRRHVYVYLNKMRTN